MEGLKQGGVLSPVSDLWVERIQTRWGFNSATWEKTFSPCNLQTRRSVQDIFFYYFHSLLNMCFVYGQHFFHGKVEFDRERGEWRGRETQRKIRMQITQQTGASYSRVFYVQNRVLFSPSKNKPVTFCIPAFCISPGHMYFCNVQNPKAHRAEWELTAVWSRSLALRSTPVRAAAARFQEKESKLWEGTLNPMFSVSYWLNLLCIHSHSRKAELYFY